MAIDYNKAWGDIESSPEYKALPKAKQREYRAKFGQFVGQKLGKEARQDFIQKSVIKQPVRQENPLLDLATGVGRQVLDQNPVAEARRLSHRAANAIVDPLSRAVGLPDSAEIEKRGGPRQDGRLMPPANPVAQSGFEVAGEALGSLVDPTNFLGPARGFQAAKAAVKALPKPAGAMTLGKAAQAVKANAPKVAKAVAKPAIQSGLIAGGINAGTRAASIANDGGNLLTPEVAAHLAEVGGQGFLLGTATGGVATTGGLASGLLPDSSLWNRSLFAKPAPPAPQSLALPAPRAMAPLMLPEKTSGPILPSDGSVIPMGRVLQRPATPNANQALTPEVIPAQPIPAPPKPPAYSYEDINEMTDLLYKQGAEASPYVAPPAAPLSLTPPRYVAPEAPQAYNLDELLEMQQLLYRQGQQNPKAPAPARNGGGSALGRLVSDESGEFRPGALQDTVEKAVVKQYLNRFDRFDIPQARPTKANPQAVDQATVNLSGKPEYSGEKYTGSINLNRLNTSDDVKATLEATQKVFKGAIDEQRRGTITDEALGKLADDLDMSFDDLAKRAVGEAWNAERILGARRLLASSGEQLTRIANEIRNGDDQSAKLLEFRKALEVHAEIQGQVSGLATEAGRALHQFNIQAKSNKAQMQELQDLVNQMGGKDAIGDLAKQVADLTGKALNKKVREVVKPTWAQKGMEAYTMAVLSAPTTHEVNAIGNAITVFDKLAEGYTAAALGLPRAAKGTANRVTFKEANAQAIGLLAGLPEGAGNAWQALKTGRQTSGSGQVEHPGAISGLKGEVIRLPGRALLVGDEFFRTVVGSMELHALAAREGLNKGLKGEALAAEVKRLIEKPTPDMRDAMRAEADYRTFQKQLGKVAIHLSIMKQKAPALGLIALFIKTPINIVKYAGERTVLAPFAKSVRSEIAKGGIHRDRALAKIALGSTVAGWALMQASSGTITGGGPSDPAQRQMKMATGWKPYSFRTPSGEYVPYARMLGQWGMILGGAADLTEGFKAMSAGKKKEMVAILIESSMKNFGEQTFWRNIAEFNKATSDPDRNLDRYLANTVAGGVPNVLGKAAAASDDAGVVRDTQGEGTLDSIGKAIQGKVPKNDLTPDIAELPVKTDPLGRPIQRENTGAAAVFNPISIGRETEDPVIRAFADAGVSIGNAPKKITIEGVELALTEDLQRTYKRVRGEAIEKLMNEEILSHPKWEGLKANQTRKAEILDEVKRAAFKEAKEVFMKQHKKELVQIHRAGKAGTP